MSFITSFFVAILMGYIAMTNALASELAGLFTNTPQSEIASDTEQSDTVFSSLAQLPSRFTNIPDVLLQSAEYQQAAVAGTLSQPTAATTEPLDAIVNIFCTFTTPERVRTTTGTGFFIDADGVILTNAHVAQFLLLAETDALGKTNCIVRSGNPAAPQYRAELLYLPPAWVVDNAGIYNDIAPIGTGERDYALLYVTSDIQNQPLPTVFPALPFDATLLPVSTKNTNVVAAGYPATDLLTRGPDVDLLARRATTTVSELYTFGSNYADVFSIRGSVVGAEGASGGPVVNADGEVIGMIVTKGDDAIDGAGSLRAITISHIHRTILEETGFGLSDNLGGNLSYRSEVFNQTLTPFLLTILQSEN